jgi:hypothetical protein
MEAGIDYSRYSRYIRPTEDRPDIGLYMEVVKDDVLELVKTEKELAILKTGQKAGKIAGGIGLGVTGIIFGMIVLILLSVAMGIAFGNAFEDMALGFVAAAGVYILLGALFMVIWNSTLKDKISLYIINTIHGKG